MSCRRCEGTALVSTETRDGYGYVFRCSCGCKALSDAIPLWDESYRARGFEPLLDRSPRETARVVDVREDEPRNTRKIVVADNQTPANPCAAMG